MAKQKPSQQQATRNKGLSPHEKITRGIEALRKQIVKVEDLRQEGFPYQDALRARVALQIKETIRQVFGERSSEFQRYKNHRLDATTEADRTQTLLVLQNLIHALENERRELSEMPPASPPVFPSAPPAVTQPRSPVSLSPPSPLSTGHISPRAQVSGHGFEPTAVVLDRLRKIAERFHQVVRQLRHRGEYRATVEVEDQHDVEDLFDALLRVEFEGITKEQWVPSYANSVSQTTFFLQQGQVAIVLKKTRPGRGPREIDYELASDAERYTTFPSCLTLFCFVYDPEGRIGDPQGLEEELRRGTGSFQIELVIAPK